MGGGQFMVDGSNGPSFMSVMAFLSQMNPSGMNMRADSGDLTAKDAAFAQCCVDKGVFAGLNGTDAVVISQQACSYTNTLGANNAPELLILPINADGLRQRISSYLKCIADSQDDSACCADAGLTGSCSSICDYSAPHINIDRLLGKTDVCVESPQVGERVAQCIINNAYNNAGGAAGANSEDQGNGGAQVNGEAGDA